MTTRSDDGGRVIAAVASTLHFLTAPGVVVGLVPWWITGWEPSVPAWPSAIRFAGLAVAVLGVAVVAAEFVRFVRDGRGSPAPVVPTRHLVTGGLYRYVRNPMYVVVVAAVVGQGLWFSSASLLAYAAVLFAVVAAFVQGYEEPTLARTFGTEYDDYCRAVPRWIPRIP